MENFSKEDVQLFLDTDLAELSEYAPLTEGADLDAFEQEAQAVAAALKKAGVHPATVPAGPARSLFLMRAFYFLGVLRGGEAAIDILSNQFEDEPGEFKLSDVCTEDFAWNLKSLDKEELKRICKIISL